MSTLSLAVAIASLCLSYLLISGGLAKLRNLPYFRSALANYQLIPDRLIRPLAMLIATTELATGALLLLNQSRSSALIITAALGLTYAVAVAINLMRGRGDIECGCYGPARRDEVLSYSLVLRNLALSGFCAVLLLVKQPLQLTFAGAGLALATGLIIIVSLHATQELYFNNKRLRRLQHHG